MQSIETASASSPRRAGVRRAKRHQCRTDMTPMVDLGFLLIAFFVMTTELSKPHVMDLAMPTNKPGPQTTLGESSALTILLEGGQVYYYNGKLQDALSTRSIHPVPGGMKNVGAQIAAKQEIMDGLPGGRKELMVLIKAGDNTAYSTVINILDEMLIHKVEKYALIEMDAAEASWLSKESE